MNALRLLARIGRIAHSIVLQCAIGSNIRGATIDLDRNARLGTQRAIIEYVSRSHRKDRIAVVALLRATLVVVAHDQSRTVLREHLCHFGTRSHTHQACIEIAHLARVQTLNKHLLNLRSIVTTIDSHAEIQVRQITEIIANPYTTTRTKSIERIRRIQPRQSHRHRQRLRIEIAIIVTQIVVGRDLDTSLHTLAHAQLSKEFHATIRVVGVVFRAHQILHIAPLTAMGQINAKAITRVIGMRKHDIGRRVERIARTRLDVQHRLAMVVPNVRIGSRNGALFESSCPLHRRYRIFDLRTQRNGVVHTRCDGQFIGSIERWGVLLGYHHLFVDILSHSDIHSQQ